MSNEHFDLIAGFYNKTAQFTVSDRLLCALDLPTDGILLDAGGGTGRAAAALRDLAGAAVVVDVSMGMMKYALDKGLGCVNAPAEFLPLASGTIDRVVMLDALHHVRSQARAAAELYRALKPGGRIVVIEPDIHKFAIKLIALGEKLLLMRSRFLAGEEIADLFAGLGASVEIEYAEHNVWVTVEK